MNGHLGDRIADYLEGRLGPESMRDVERHVASCADCAADLRWAQDFRNAALTAGVRHVTPARVVELAEGQGDRGTELELRHLQSCPTCQRELEWVRSLPDSEAAERTGDDSEALPSGAAGSPRVIAGRFRPTGWHWGALVAVAAGIVALILLPLLRHPDLPRLARFDPLPVHLSRSTTGSDLFENTRLRGLELYRDGRYAEAATALQEAQALRPNDAEVRLYSGSAELQLGRFQEGMALLVQAKDLEMPRLLREELLWQIANAALALGNAPEAKAALREVETLDRRHKQDAIRILRKLE
jgi:tetratricopeptide (TPR) repeat protein